MAGLRRYGLIAALLVLALTGALGARALAAANFPPLSGRVVDQANVLSPATRDALTAKLKTLEDKSGIQLVVATVSSLDGQEIEPYANALFRTWKLGEAKKNNGVLLLVAPKERKVRIEVGYGLEGVLTDATSKIIILNAVAPRFKAGDFNGGVTQGVDDITTVLTSDQSDWRGAAPAPVRVENHATLFDFTVPLLMIVIFLFAFAQTARSQGGFGRALVYILTSMLLNGGGRSGGGFSGGGSFGGGGFSGGGGSSGGGGASGSW